MFHPQGGGQPSDVGEIRFSSTTFVVSKVNSPVRSERSRGVIWHIGNFTTSTGDSKQQDVSFDVLKKESPSQHVDRASRMLYAKLHSAGHLADRCDATMWCRTQSWKWDFTFRKEVTWNMWVSSMRIRKIR